MKNIFIVAFFLMISGSTVAQQFTENDYKMFKEAQLLTDKELKFADEITPWNSIQPKRVYSLHNEGDETIVTFSHSIYFDSQWVTFSKGIMLIDCETGDIYKARDYAMEGFTMDKLIIVNGCNKKNVLISIRFPKLKRKVKFIDVYDNGHKDDLSPSNRRVYNGYLGQYLSVKTLKNKYKGGKVYE